MDSVLDVYVSYGIVYIDLNPAKFIELQNEPKFTIQPAPTKLILKKTTEYNVAIFLELEFHEIPDTILLDGQLYQVKQQSPLPLVDLQLCLVFKDEWYRIPTVLNYYRRVHGVQRFILYDNQSADPPPADLVSAPDVVYEQWNIPYKHTLQANANLSADYTGPETIIVAQNSAYSHCLKRYRQATWTALFDTDEFLVRRRDNLSLLNLVKSFSPAVSTIIVKGYWAGCNSLQQSELYNSLRKITKRSAKFCMNKLILKTADHVYTNCIHTAYPSRGKKVTLAFERGVYFFHLYTASTKNRPCSCGTYCRVQDPSFQESFIH